MRPDRSKQLLYLFGEPGTGKITVARILQQRLGWRLFWLHDLDSISQIVGRYPLPRLMDRVSLAVLEELLVEGQNVIYVRPSRDQETVARVADLAKAAGYSTHLFRLWAAHEVLVRRVSSREKTVCRISSEEELNLYLAARPVTSHRGLGAVTIRTDFRTPEQVADRIQHVLEKEIDYGSRCRRTDGYAAV